MPGGALEYSVRDGVAVIGLEHAGKRFVFVSVPPRFIALPDPGAIASDVVSGLYRIGRLVIGNMRRVFCSVPGFQKRFAYAKHVEAQGPDEALAMRDHALPQLLSGKLPCVALPRGENNFVLPV